MGETRRVSIAVIKRLPRYYRYLGALLDNNITRISSTELSERMNITASQVRQDLNNFGCFGQQGYGYNVDVLYEQIKKILGLDQSYNIIILGAGNIGQALTNYANFERRGFNFVGIFDANPKLIGMKVRDIEISDIEILESFLNNNKVDIAVIALPRDSVYEVLGILQKSKIKGIWNFSPLDIDLKTDVVVENVHLTDSLMTLSYQINEKEILARYAK